MTVRQPLRSLLVAATIGIALAACGTDEQTLAPSASASPVQAPPNPRLVEFETRLASALTREGQLVRDLAAASAGTHAQLSLVASQMADWAIDELRWLRDHPADACYADAVDAYSKGLNTIGLAAGMFAVIAEASGPPDASDGQFAGQTLADGGASLERASTLARSARVDCS